MKPRSRLDRTARALLVRALTVTALPVTTALPLAACSGASASGNANASTRSADTANVAARAAEPRENDPTGAAPSQPAGSGVSLGGGKSPPPRSSPPATIGGGTSPEPADDPKAPGPGDDAPPAKLGAAPTQPEPPKRIGARHVLIQYMGAERAAPAVVRSREQARSVAEEVLRRAKAGDDFARLAIEFSDEPNAGSRGGSLGRFTRGQMVGAFEAAAFKLAIGEISDIVESPFGFHIIQRTE